MIFIEDYLFVFVLIRYNSGGKQFSPVPTKHFSVQCDAITIQSSYWQNRKTSVNNNNQVLQSSALQINNFNK